MSPDNHPSETFHEDYLWYAMSATFGREMKAKAFLDEQNVECFVPMRYQIQKDKNNRNTRTLVSAISNLIFVYTSRQQIQQLKTQALYLHYLTHPVNGRNIPITVPEYQMRQFITVCNTHNEKHQYLTPDEVNLSQGTRVRIAGGDFDGIEGTFVKVSKGRKKRVVIMIEGVIGVALAEITDGYIQVIQP